jgi:hypothetical protein
VKESRLPWQHRTSADSISLWAGLRLRPLRTRRASESNTRKARRLRGGLRRELGSEPVSEGITSSMATLDKRRFHTSLGWVTLGPLRLFGGGRLIHSLL